ncbi:MAG: mechanosensitive ion channel family protein [Clostridia bacterium]
MKWNEKTQKAKVLFIIKAFVWLLAATLVALAIFSKELFNADSAFAHIFNGDESGFHLIGTWIDNQVPIMLKSIVYIVIILAVSKLLRFIIAKLLLTSKKGRTATKLIDSFIRYFTAIVTCLIVLLIFGVNPLALFASVGVLGLVIGLGAQSLINDILSGIFIVFESAYEVGDYIVIDGFRGKVESIGIRTTQFVDYGGNIKIINNSEIKTVVNLSYADSLLTVEVTIKQHEFQRAEAVINANIQKIRESLPQFSYGPNYIGVSDFTNQGIQLKFAGKVNEEIRFQAERDLRREIKLLFDQHNIDIALPKFYVEEVAKK